ncbi:MAG: 50S ribosomal protein L29 [Omnitrophica bacterium RIFCSPHIGHO2_02_FULL_63_14]|nr:MAG: 50S ribosomal protein L29 [Omnitrophica bacterium RIFCSPHIGHO2_02_FULL_63_14]
MTIPKARELRNLSVAELQQKRDALDKQLHALRQKKVTGQLDKPHFFKRLRRQIAQLHTLEREKKNA